MDAFTAIASPVRRHILLLLAEGPRNAGSLAEEFELSRSAVSEHLQVLRKAAFVREEIRGREHYYSLAPGAARRSERMARAVRALLARAPVQSFHLSRGATD